MARIINANIIPASLRTLFVMSLLLIFSTADAALNNHLNKNINPNLATAPPTTAAQAQPVPLDPNVLNCFIQLPNALLSATGLSTPFQLKRPCSMGVATQQAYAEAAVVAPDGTISIYHPLVINEGTTPKVTPVVPNIPQGSIIGIWFGFNGGVLQLVDSNGNTRNNSPILKGAKCVQGLNGVPGDVFGQVSWCNAQKFFNAANAAIQNGKTKLPPLGTTKAGKPCPTTRSFVMVDACPNDNVPTQYLLLADGVSTVQDTAANRQKFPDATVINNASDETLLVHILDPLIGCTAFLAPSLTDPGTMTGALALAELQAAAQQQAPISLVPMKDPDCLLTANGNLSAAKTNQYRAGVNQLPLGTGPGTDQGLTAPFCMNMAAEAPVFFNDNNALFSGATSPDAGVGNNLLTFLCNRYLMSVAQLDCAAAVNGFNPRVACSFGGNGVCTTCTITL